ncbi:unnamed protein product [Rotaria sordida]|uniref:NAD(P)(+)--arginine ADP-ribosyltransferase n=1 Tax=Rotaria sordida TaxID=392033 RepID=A0A814AKX7_9BILA|nr:unnamed protein product [Rotaria sordida]
MMIKHVNADRVITFTSPDGCINYINSLKNTNQPICLITSGSLGITVIPLIHNIDQIESIIVFCVKKTKYEYMQKRYRKIHKILNTHKELIIHLEIYLKSIDKNGLKINIFDIEKLKSLRNFNSISDSSHLKYTIFDENKQCPMHDILKADTFFLWLKLITSVLQKVHHTHNTMKEMLDECRDYYKDNIEELNKIEEFSKKYKSEDAIYWYTTPTFVSKLINKALRTEDFRALYICRAYIADLSEQLRKEYEQYKQLLIEFEQPLTQWIVYHGRTMSKEEIDILCSKKDQLISLNGFLSTSRKPEIANCYSKEVIFIIQTTFNLSYGCFAHVAPMSQFPQEDEVLFDLASVFKIIDIKYDNINEKWNIYLRTTDEGTNLVQAYINSVKIEANETNVDFIFARLLIQMGEYELTHDYLTKLATIISDENETRDLALIYYYKGLNLYREGNYSQSMIEYEKALGIQRKIFPNGHSDLGETLGGIGLLYDNMGQYELALEKHLECLSISEKTLPKDHVHIAEGLNNIGLCYDRLGKFELALEYDIRALEMKQRLFPYDHPDIATSLNNIGLAYYNHCNFEQALDYHQQSLAMKERCLPPDHPEFAVSYCNLGLAHLALNHYNEALLYHIRDLSMSEKTLPADHAEIGITHHNLGQVYRAKEKGSHVALQHYQKAVDIYMKSLPRQHQYIGRSLMYIGEILCDQDNLEDAFQYAQEAFHILEATLSEEHARCAESAYILAKVYKKMNQYDKALEYAYKAHNIQLKTLDINHEEVQKTVELIKSIEVMNNA